AIEAAGEAAAAGAIGWVNATANGTRPLDRLEVAALGRALGAALPGTPVASLKGAIGDGMASGGLRAAASCLAISDGVVPFTAGLDAPDPALREAAGHPLDLVRGSARDLAPRAVLQTGIGDAGGLLSLVFARATVP
ncbi:MAG TPA: beta-ACP synthase, partial [Planctomycetota bacterium]|nr:beta-ACP synthase [Planctomycetota bacterium]